MRSFINAKTIAIIFLPIVVGALFLANTNKKPEFLNKEPSRRLHIEKPYWQEVNDIHEAALKIREGDAYRRSKNFAQALLAYKEAYELDPGSRHVSGFLLAEAYEQEGRYYEAIGLLNQMIEKRELSELGIQNAKKMISQLTDRQ